MTIETTRSMLMSLHKLFSRMIPEIMLQRVIKVPEDKSMVTTDGEETIAKVTQRVYSILTIYEHALETYTKLSSHTVKLSNTPGKTGKKKNHNIYTTVQPS